MKNILLIVSILFLLTTAGQCNEKMQKKEKGQLHLSAPATTSVITANQYIKVSGNFTDGIAKNFVLTTDGKLTYTGYGNDILFIGVSDLSVNKNCNMSYALFKNGVLVTGAETPHSFTGVSKTETISITHIMYIEHGDYFEVYCKSDEVNTDLLVTNLCVTFWGR